MQKEIKDPEGVLKVLSALFGKLPAFIHSDGKDYPVKIIALKNKALIINTQLRFSNQLRIVSVIHNGSKFLAQLTLIGGDGHGIEILKPEKILIVPATRQGNRVEISTSSDNTLKVTNLVNVIDISKAIGFLDEKVDTILLANRKKLSESHPISSIFFSSHVDIRSRLMQQYDKVIFIPNRKDKHSASPVYFPYDEYLKIFNTSKLSEEISSEISIPLRYKGYHYLGYVQILSEAPLGFDELEKAENFANSLSSEIISTGVFQETKESCLVMDLSSGGVSFLQSPTRTFSRSMILGGTIIFDLMIDDVYKATLRANIKNIKNLETNFRVGCQFYNVNPKDCEILENILNKDGNVESPLES